METDQTILKDISNLDSPIRNNHAFLLELQDRVFSQWKQRGLVNIADFDNNLWSFTLIKQKYDLLSLTSLDIYKSGISLEGTSTNLKRSVIS